MTDTSAQLRSCIEAGDVAGVRALLGDDPELANRPIRWHLNQDNESEPLHFVCDCVGHGWLANGSEGEIASVLIEHGASPDGRSDGGSPLIAAASMAVDRVAQVLIAAGADPERTGLFGARALHWASWVGSSHIVSALLARGAGFEFRCSEFGATPLFWAVHGYGPRGPANKADQVEAARVLIAAGAEVATRNKEGLAALDLAGQCQAPDMRQLLASHANPRS